MARFTEESSERLPNSQAGRCRIAGEPTRDSTIRFFPSDCHRWLVGSVGGSRGCQAQSPAVRKSRIVPDSPSNLRISGFPTPFRVACVRMGNGSHIYLGLSERDELRVLSKLRLRFILLWLLIVFIGSAIVFYSTRRVLRHVREITEAASRIGEADLSSQSSYDAQKRRSRAVGNHAEPDAGPDRKVGSSIAHDHGIARARSSESSDRGASQAGNVPDRSRRTKNRNPSSLLSKTWIALQIFWTPPWTLPKPKQMP